MKVELKRDLNTHILVVDDNRSIHDDFAKTLSCESAEKNASLSDLEGILFDEGELSNEAENPSSTELELVNICYHIDDAYSGEEAVSLVQKSDDTAHPYALIFMDVRMPPGMNGIEAIGKIWEINPYIEIVICTAYSDYSWDDIVNKLGTTDRLLFLKKPFNAVEVKQIALSLVIKWNLNVQNRHLIKNLELEVTERTRQLEGLYRELEVSNRVLEEKNRLLAELAQKDGLSGLFNHVTLYEKFDAAFKQAVRQKFSISVTMVDIDHFKQFNDYYGHQMGDQVIKKVAEILRSGLREYDVKLRYQETANPGSGSSSETETLEELKVAGRYGGDEFILILPYCGYSEADVITRRLQKRIRAVRIEGYPDLKVTASIGCGVLSDPATCEDAQDVIKLADHALYKAKENGRDQAIILSYES
ncbi:MAG: diguanylate cyclase [Thermodesulfobacteriota bacterium]|nr:diguanylate cyclase [Thermodesulfobacteriota bacterium]